MTSLYAEFQPPDAPLSPLDILNEAVDQAVPATNASSSAPMATRRSMRSRSRSPRHPPTLDSFPPMPPLPPLPVSAVTPSTQVVRSRRSNAAAAAATEATTVVTNPALINAMLHSAVGATAAPILPTIDAASAAAASASASPAIYSTHNFSSSGALHPGDVTDEKIPGFIRKTFNMVSNEATAAIVTWDAHGTSFLINKMDDFSNQILPQYFRHKNFSSFVRQLNFYGFHKQSKPGVNPIAFGHEYFRKGQKDLLAMIKRNKSEASGGGSTATNGSAAAVPGSATISSNGAAANGTHANSSTSAAADSSINGTNPNYKELYTELSSQVHELKVNYESLFQIQRKILFLFSRYVQQQQPSATSSSSSNSRRDQERQQQHDRPTREPQRRRQQQYQDEDEPTRGGGRYATRNSQQQQPSRPNGIHSHRSPSPLPHSPALHSTSRQSASSSAPPSKRPRLLLNSPSPHSPLNPQAQQQQQQQQSQQEDEEMPQSDVATSAPQASSSGSTTEPDASHQINTLHSLLSALPKSIGSGKHPHTSAYQDSLNSLANMIDIPMPPQQPGFTQRAGSDSASSRLARAISPRNPLRSLPILPPIRTTPRIDQSVPISPRSPLTLPIGAAAMKREENTPIAPTPTMNGIATSAATSSTRPPTPVVMTNTAAPSSVVPSAAAAPLSTAPSGRAALPSQLLELLDSVIVPEVQQSWSRDNSDRSIVAGGRTATITTRATNGSGSNGSLEVTDPSLLSSQRTLHTNAMNELLSDLEHGVTLPSERRRSRATIEEAIDGEDDEEVDSRQWVIPAGQTTRKRPFNDTEPAGAPSPSYRAPAARPLPHSSSAPTPSLPRSATNLLTSKQLARVSEMERLLARSREQQRMAEEARARVVQEIQDEEDEEGDYDDLDRDMIDQDEMNDEDDAEWQHQQQRSNRGSSSRQQQQYQTPRRDYQPHNRSAPPPQRYTTRSADRDRPPPRDRYEHRTPPESSSSQYRDHDRRPIPRRDDHRRQQQYSDEDTPQHQQPRRRPEAHHDTRGQQQRREPRDERHDDDRYEDEQQHEQHHQQQQRHRGSQPNHAPQQQQQRQLDHQSGGHQSHPHDHVSLRDLHTSSSPPVQSNYLLSSVPLSPSILFSPPPASPSSMVLLQQQRFPDPDVAPLLLMPPSPQEAAAASGASPRHQQEPVQPFQTQQERNEEFARGAYSHN